MPHITEKVQILMSADIEKMIARAQETKSLKVMDEYIRQVDRNLKALEDSAATVGGAVRTLKRKYEEYNKQSSEVDHDLDNLILRGKEELSLASGNDDVWKYERVSGLAQEYYEVWQQQEAVYKNLLVMYVKLEERLDTIKHQREKLKYLANTNKAILVNRTLSYKDAASLIEFIYAQKQREGARAETVYQSIEVTQADKDKVQSDIAACRKRLLDKD